MEEKQIKGVDIQRGIAMTGGSPTVYCQVLSLYCKDAEARLPLLKTLPTVEALPLFTSQAHALKGASASIGATEISVMASKLEIAGKAGDLAFIQENLSGFAQDLAELVKGIRVWTSADVNTSGAESKDSATAHNGVTQLLHDLASALQAQKACDIDRTLEELMKQTMDAKTKEALEKISDDVLMTEYDCAAETVHSLLNNANKT